ncbi:ABC transporter substrate-binding protein [Methanoculleus frigidifontis]|nr:helical backbone metal receptor [Methanoculleus sp. FWC-SCC1]
MRTALFCVTLVLLLTTAGCLQATDDAAATLAVTDDTGVQAVLSTPVARVVSLAPSETEVVCALGMDALLVGKTDYCNYPPKIEGAQSVGGPKTLNVEKIIGLQPDLVLATTVTDTTKIEGIRAMGIPVLIFRLESLEDIHRNIETVGTVLDCPDAAAALVGRMQEREANVSAARHPAEPAAVLYVLWDDPLYVAGNNTLQDDLIRRAGGVNIMADAEGYVVASDEAVLTRAPDVIIASTSHTAGTAPIKDRLLARSVFADVPAFRNGHIVTIDADLANRPGPRMVDTLELFAACINA